MKSLTKLYKYILEHWYTLTIIVIILPLKLQLSSGKAGVLAAKILVHCRSQLSSDEEVASLWSSASLEWSALGVASEDLEEFLSTHVSCEGCQPVDYQ